MKTITASLALTFLILSGCSSKPSIIIDESLHGTDISVQKGELVEVRLRAQLGTGYSWKPVAIPDSVKPEGEPFQEKIEDKLKAGGFEYQIFRYRAVAEGTAELIFEYDRIWEQDKTPEKILKFTIEINGSYDND